MKSNRRACRGENTMASHFFALASWPGHRSFRLGHGLMAQRILSPYNNLSPSPSLPLSISPFLFIHHSVYHSTNTQLSSINSFIPYRHIITSPPRAIHKTQPHQPKCTSSPSSPRSLCPSTWSSPPRPPARPPRPRCSSRPVFILVKT